MDNMARRGSRVHSAARADRGSAVRRSLGPLTAAVRRTRPRGAPVIPAIVSDLLRPVGDCRAPVEWDQGLSALAEAVSTVGDSESPDTPVSEATFRTRSDPGRSRAPVSAVNRDETKAQAEGAFVLSRPIEMSPVPAPGVPLITPG
jgi:hypothetical protein